jgi:hypothetical protein
MLRIHWAYKATYQGSCCYNLFWKYRYLLLFIIYRWCNLSLSLEVYFIDNIISELRRPIVFICLFEMKHVLYTTLHKIKMR